MPSLFRFLTILVVLGAVCYGAMWSLATFVKPTTRPMETPVPLSKLDP
jgi:hypothetical protein